MQLPTMLVAGAQKCGTSTLATTLNMHPEIFMTRRPKEVHFFDREFDRGIDWYASHFRPGPEHVHAGEATPVYMYDHQARRRMAETVPDAKIVVILRDPAKRAYSHYWHRRRKNGEPAPTFVEAIEREGRDFARGTPPHPKHAYLARGHYVDQLLDLERGHGRDNLHVMLLEDLGAERTTTLTTLFEFLGVDASQADAIPEQWSNRYRVPTDDGTAKPVDYPPISPETRSLLVETYREDNERLAEWLGRDLSAWNSL